MPTPRRFPGRPGDWLVHKDNQLMVFNKPAGLPTIPDRQDSPNLLQIAAAYARRDLYPAHRLDRPVSGLVIFTRKPSAQTKLTEQFRQREVKKTYLAIVGERPAKDEATLKNFLREGPHNRTGVVDAEGEGTTTAELSYRYIGSSDRYHMLHVEPSTGRKHQIRAQLAAIGCPVRGDEKYGFHRANGDGTIDLHAYRLSFAHPVSERTVSLVAPPPATPVWEAFSAFIDA